MKLIYCFFVVAGAWRNGKATIKKTAPFYISTDAYVSVFYLSTRQEQTDSNGVYSAFTQQNPSSFFSSSAAACQWCPTKAESRNYKAVKLELNDLKLADKPVLFL